MMFRNRRSLAIQIGVMQMSLDKEKPDINKIYKMPEDKMKELFAELKRKISTK